ncbi:MAG: glycosyltransferase family 4 protein [Chloroflexi bacterium]|nr:glycosyltransferase family 4 protein [Chloroflexota bacterium]
MRILYSALTEYFWMHVVEVVNNLAELGHEVHLATFLRSRPPRLHHSVSFHNLSLRNRPWQDFLAPPFLDALIRCGLERLAGRGDSIYASWIGHIVDSASFDLIYEREGNVAPAIAVAHARSIPSILEFNAIWPLEMQWKGYSPSEAQLALEVRLEAACLATRVVSVSAGARDYYSEHGASLGKFRVIPNGAAIDLFHPLEQRLCRERLGLGTKDKLIGYTGSLQPFYDIQCVIRAMPSILRRVPTAHFVAVGRDYKPPFGPGRENLKNLSRELGLASRVHLLEAVPYEEVPIHIGSFDLCLLPLAKKDGWQAALSPLKLREYMACARPVVASDIPGDSQVLGQARAGLLYEPGDREDIAEKICRLLESPELACSMGQNGRRHVLECGTWRHTAESILAVAEEAIADMKQTKAVLVGRAEQ